MGFVQPEILPEKWREWNAWPSVTWTAMSWRRKRAAETEKIQGFEARTSTGITGSCLEHKELDAVMIGTPDHWHCLPMVEACQAGTGCICGETHCQFH
jgi:predicted dehydrogenase